MQGLDDWISGLGGGGFATAMLVALLLGLRHATDPDHVTAVSTLVLSDARDGARRARRLGAAWGAGHASTLLIFGLPVVLWGDGLPEWAQSAAETAVGVLIVALAARLLVRWRRGSFHVHPHAHGAIRHTHPHAHEPGHAPGRDHPHSHGHAEALGRSPLAALGIGVVHGVGGSAGAALLLIAATSGRVHALAALFLFAAATALSMALLTSALGALLARRPATRALGRVVPVVGVGTLAFGVWYAGVGML